MRNTTTVILGALAALALSASDVRAYSPVPQANAAADTAKEKGDKKDKKDKDDDDKDWVGGPLFTSSDSVLRLTIRTDLRALLKDRDSTKVVNHPGTLTYTEADGKELTLPIQLRTRGIWRRKTTNCDFPPLRFNLPAKDSIKQTLFAKHKVIKMVTHCRTRANDYEQYTMQEHLVYRAYNRITPLSFRTRLAIITYIDQTGKSDTVRKHAILLEDDDDVAKRHRMRVITQIGGTLDDVQQTELARASLFQYMIGNTDWAIYNLHNIRLLSDSLGQPYAVPYDWDFSGIVNTRYATPDPRLGLKTVRDRAYRGNCLPDDQWAPIIAKYNAEKDSIYAIMRSLPSVEKNRTKNAIDYLDDFYKTINDKRSFRSQVIAHCKTGPG